MSQCMFCCQNRRYELYLSWLIHKQWKKNKFGHFKGVVQLIHRLTQGDTSYTTTARVFFFPLLAQTASGICFQSIMMFAALRRKYILGN